jgi:drug/metabolite transporter (DMT)-like permease
MKASMTICLFLYYFVGYGKEPGIPDPSIKTIKAVWKPAILDLLNTVLGNIGLVWVNSSIYQMTRGSVVIFSAFLSVKWLGRRLRHFHYWSIGFVTIAVIFVGTAGIEEKPPTDDDCVDDGDDGDDGSSANGGEILLGLFFILLAQAVTAVQFIVEESLMNDQSTQLSPVALVGFEGLWGVFYFAILAPILTVTPRSDMAIATLWHEDFLDSFKQISNSNTLLVYVIAYCVAIVAYNLSANTVTQCLSAVVRSILEACRTMGVWMVGILLFYLGGTCGTKEIGERWTNWSFLELFGFLILLYGTFSYKALVKMPWVAEEQYVLAKKDNDTLAEVSEHGRKSRCSTDKDDVYTLLEPP